MKRCKAVTSRACDSIECTLLADHDGAHEGQRDNETRAVWTNPEAPAYMPLDGGALPGSVQEFEQQRAERLTLPAQTEPEKPKTPQTHCACGTEHDRKLDPTLRTEFAMPLQAFRFDSSEPDQRFAWPLICRDCGAVYCPIHPSL